MSHEKPFLDANFDLIFANKASAKSSKTPEKEMDNKKSTKKTKAQIEEELENKQNLLKPNSSMSMIIIEPCNVDDERRNFNDKKRGP